MRNLKFETKIDHYRNEKIYHFKPTGGDAAGTRHDGRAQEKRQEDGETRRQCRERHRRR